MSINSKQLQRWFLFERHLDEEEGVVIKTWPRLSIKSTREFSLVLLL